MTDERVRMSRLRAQFLRRNIKVMDDWLEDCVKFFIEQIPNVTDDQLLENAMQQFLLGNLADIGLPSIPETVLTVDGKQIIEGKFVVQVQSIIDVCESCYFFLLLQILLYKILLAQSAYDQLQNLYNKKVDTTADEDAEGAEPRTGQPKQSKK